MLQTLFTPQEAELATYLTLDREPAGVIAERAGLAVPEAEKRLDEMAVKGLILSTDWQAVRPCTRLCRVSCGIWEYRATT